MFMLTTRFKLQVPMKYNFNQPYTIRRRGVRERLFKRFSRLKSGQFHLNLNV